MEARATLCHQEAMDVDGEPQADCAPEDVLRVLIENDFNGSFRVLGNQLGLKPYDLNILEMSQCPKEELLGKILHKCGEKELLSWTKLVSVLRKPAIKQYRIANKICLERNLSLSSRAESGSSMHSSTSLSFEDFPTYLNPEAEPEIADVVNEIAEVANWERLALMLGLSMSDIEKIKSCYDQSEHHQRLAEMWHDRDKSSWSQLLGELDRLYPRRKSSVSVASPQPENFDVESQIKNFEKQFKKLNIEARRELEEKYNSRSIKIITDELTFLPISIAREHQKYVTRIIQRKRPFTNLTLFFMHLNLHCWNFFEYQILENLIENKCSDTLKEQMAKYAKEIEEFRQKTTITEFIKSGYLPLKDRSIPPRFKKITIEHAIDPDIYTLADLDHFRKDTYKALHLRLSECAFQVFKIKHGSIIVEWMIPEDLKKLVQDLFYMYSKSGLMIIQIHSVKNISIDGIEVTAQSLHLLAAAKEGNISQVMLLLEDTKTNINHQDPERHSYTALHFAAIEGHVELLDFLLKKGCDVNLTAGEKGCTPLQLVCLNRDKPSKRRAEMVKLLLDYDTKLYIEDTDGRTPLFAASRSGFVDTVKLILEKVKELPQRKQRRALNHTMMNGWTPIMDAAMHGHAEVIKLLLEAGATAIKTKEDDETALHIAAYHGHVEAVKVLTANQDRFVINARDQYGLTPLMMATKNGKVEAANLLLEAGADVNLQSNDKERRTALMFAAKNGVFSIVKLLLKFKPNVNIIDSSNKTALDLAKTSEIRHCLKVAPETVKKEQIGVSS